MDYDVSFIVAAFNSAETIGAAVESVLRQRGVTAETIVIDDASRDATPDVVAAFANPDVRLVSLAENRGPGGARNVALNHARGRWIAVLDADDTIEPDRSARMIMRAEATGAEIVLDNLFIVDAQGRSPRPMFEPALLAAKEGLQLSEFIDGNIMFKTSFDYGYMKPMVSRQFVQTHALRYNEELRIGEDYLFLAALLAKGARCAFEPTAGYNYHIRSGSLSRIMELRHVEAMREADEAFVAQYPLDEAVRAALARRRRSLDKAAAFLALVRHIKARAPLKALATALEDPAAVLHLRMPLAARFQRLGAFLTGARAQ